MLVVLLLSQTEELKIVLLMVCVYDPSLMFPRNQFQLDRFPKRPFPQGISQHCSWMIVLTIDQLLSYMIVCSLGLLPLYSISPCWSCRSKGRIQVRVRNRMLLIAYTAVSTGDNPASFWFAISECCANSFARPDMPVADTRQPC